MPWGHQVLMGSRGRRWLVAFIAVTFGVIVLAPLMWDAVLSGMLTVEVLKPLHPGPIGWVTRSPQEGRVTFPGGHRIMEANLYTPAGRGKRAAVVLVHGVVGTGKDDPRMVWLARLLARSGFVVLVPDFSGFKSLRLRVSDIREMSDAVIYLHSLHERVLPGRIGMIGFSYGAGPMLIAAADPRVEGRLKFVVSFGGYYDLVQVIKFVTTGYYQYEEERGYARPSDYTRWIFLRYNLDLLRDPIDQAILARLANTRESGGPGESPALPSDLTPEGRSVYNLLVNRDPEKVEALVNRLAPSIREMIEQLSPSRQVRRLAAYAIIIHSDPDPFIPHTESLALAKALAYNKAKVRLEILRLFRHVRPELPETTLGNFFTVYVPQGFHIYSLIFDLLRQRR
ncbi:MAG: alpha/beta hydrolase [Candidatus Methylomirabilis oxyfera]|nr:alpha/beta hydrolase [Candidatus Methylomirabilis oxyfera]